MFKRGLSSASSLGVGGFPSDLVSTDIIDVMEIIIAEHPEVIFCGSLGLVASGKLNRPVKDIDILTPENWYNKLGFLNMYRTPKSAGSHKFMMGNDPVLCFSLLIKGIKVDVLFNEKKFLNTGKKDFTAKELKSRSQKEL